MWIGARRCHAIGIISSRPCQKARMNGRPSAREPARRLAALDGPAAGRIDEADIERDEPAQEAPDRVGAHQPLRLRLAHSLRPRRRGRRAAPRMRLLGELQRVEPGIDAAAAQQLGMAAGLGDAAAIDDVDEVGIDDGREAVGDDHGGAAAHQRLERRLHLALGFGVERRGRLVEQQDRRVLQHGAGDGEPLALAARELDAVLADHGVVALGQRADEIVGGGAPWRRRRSRPRSAPKRP